MNADIAAVDRALVGLFEDLHAERALAELGPVAFHRVGQLYREGGPDFPERLAELIGALGRESLDCWAHAIHVVSVANPSLYVDQLEGEPSARDVRILGKVDDPRAVALLAGALQGSDSIVRSFAVEALGGRPEPEAYELAISALDNPAAGVRLAAIKVLGGREPAAAIARYEAELARGDLTPLPAQEARYYVAELSG